MSHSSFSQASSVGSVEGAWILLIVLAGGKLFLGRVDEWHETRPKGKVGIEKNERRAHMF